MKEERSRREKSRGLIVKAWLLVAALLAVGLFGSSCVTGLQSIGWSGGTVSNNTLFVGSRQGRLVSVDLTNDARQWSEALKSTSTSGLACLPAGGGCGSAPSGVAIYGSPVVYEELVYIGGYNGKVYAFNSSTLETRWVYPRDSYLEPIVGGLAEANGNVYFGDSDGNVYALDAATGDKVWTFTTADRVWTTPTVVDDTVYAGSFDKKMYALNAADGALKWEYQADGAISSAAVVVDGVVYFGNLDRNLYAVNAADGTLKWKFMGGNWFWATPVIVDNVVYAGCLDDKVYAVSVNNGDLVTEFDLQSPVSSSPVIIDARIFFASQAGVVYAVDTANQGLQRVADIGAKVYGPLATNGTIIFMHTQDLTLHQVNAVTGAILPSISLETG